MSECPKCRAELGYLRNFTLRWTEYRFELAKDGSPSYVADSICLSDAVENEYVCPECDEKLFVQESEAIAFLQGGKG